MSISLPTSKAELKLLRCIKCGKFNRPVPPPNNNKDNYKCPICQGIALPLNNRDKKARYRMLVKQGSLSIQQARQAYRDYLGRLKNG